MASVIPSSCQIVNTKVDYCPICKKVQEIQIAIDSITSTQYLICSCCQVIMPGKRVSNKLPLQPLRSNHQSIPLPDNKRKRKKREKDKLKELQKGIIPNNQWIDNSNSKPKRSINIPIAKFVYYRLYSPSTVSPSQH